jgi:hypothetical protein
MEFYCPECMGTLVSADGQTAHCSIHGGEFRILFSRAPLPLPARQADAPPPQLMEAAMCAAHPAVAAAFACRDCGTPICSTCAFPDPDGHICASCATRRAMNPVAAPQAIPEGMRCVQHPNVTATAQCHSCRGYMCATCAFSLPGGVQVCPTCATMTKRPLTSKRKKFLIGSYACAVWCSVIMAALLGGVFAKMGATKEGEEAVGLLLFLFLLAPGITGVALSVGSMDRRLPNPLAIWVAAIWNGLLLAVFFLLMIVGLFMKHR